MRDVAAMLVRCATAYLPLTVLVICVVACLRLTAFARPRTTPTPQPTPIPSPTPLSDAARLERMRAQLEALARDAPGRLGIAVLYLSTGARYAVRGDEAFPLQSVSKVAIAVAAYRRADQRKLDLDRRVVVTRGDLRRGHSPIARRHPRGAALTYWELVRAMLVESDNTASDVLLRTVGGPAEVDGLLRRLNVEGFSIRKSEAEMASDERLHRTFAQGADNAGTPSAVAELFAGIATQRYTLLDSTNELLLSLDDVQTGPERLRAGFPPGARLAHKTGSSMTVDGITEATNDAGILTLRDGRRIALAALLADSRADDATRFTTLARVARAVYDAYGP